MTPALRYHGVAAVLLDIEGTTTPIAFVHQVLFPYARLRLGAYLRDGRNAQPVREAIAALKAEHAADVTMGARPPRWRDWSPSELLDSVETYARWLMDRDRKASGLKLLQGQIWEHGYRAGDLQGEVYRDTAPAIRRWRASGLDVAIYSSGSVLAQRLLFQSTPDGDLTALLSGFFDTAVGPKTAADSYARIARELGRDPSQIVFVSDVTTELVAARAAGLRVVLSIRPGNAPQRDAGAFDALTTFDELLPT